MWEKPGEATSSLTLLTALVYESSVTILLLQTSPPGDGNSVSGNLRTHGFYKPRLTSKGIHGLLPPSAMLTSAFFYKITLRNALWFPTTYKYPKHFLFLLRTFTDFCSVIPQLTFGVNALRILLIDRDICYSLLLQQISKVWKEKTLACIHLWHSILYSKSQKVWVLINI